MSHLESATAPPASSAGRRLVCLLVGCAVFLGTVLCAPTTSVSAATARKVLIFSKTAGFRHTSIPNGIAAIVQLGRSNGFTVTTTEDSGQFTEQNLPSTKRSSGCPPPAMSSATPSGSRSRPTLRLAAVTSASTQRPIPGTTGLGTAALSVATSTATRKSNRLRSTSMIARPRPLHTWVTLGSAPTSGTTFEPTRGRRSRSCSA